MKLYFLSIFSFTFICFNIVASERQFTSSEDHEKKVLTQKMNTRLCHHSYTYLGRSAIENFMDENFQCPHSRSQNDSKHISVEDVETDLWPMDGL